MPPAPGPAGLSPGCCTETPEPGTEDKKGGSSLTETPPKRPKVSHSHLNSPYLDAWRGLVQSPGDFGAELHHVDRCHRQGDLLASPTPSLTTGSVIKSWDTANLLCHLLPCLLSSVPSCKPPCTEPHGARGPPEPWCQVRGHAGGAATPSARPALQLMGPNLGPGGQARGAISAPVPCPVSKHGTGLCRAPTAQQPQLGDTCSSPGAAGAGPAQPGPGTKWSSVTRPLLTHTAHRDKHALPAPDPLLPSPPAGPCPSGRAHPGPPGVLRAPVLPRLSTAISARLAGLPTSRRRGPCQAKPPRVSCLEAGRECWHCPEGRTLLPQPCQTPPALPQKHPHPIPQTQGVASPTAQPQGWVPEPHPQANLMPGAMVAMGCAVHPVPTLCPLTVAKPSPSLQSWVHR